MTLVIWLPVFQRLDEQQGKESGSFQEAFLKSPLVFSVQPKDEDAFLLNNSVSDRFGQASKENAGSHLNTFQQMSLVLLQAVLSLKLARLRQVLSTV